MGDSVTVDAQEQSRNEHLEPRLIGSPGAGIVLAYAFCFQIYFDFSAYTDIARGSAKLFTIRLTPNFLTPYFSRSPSEFWQRWHWLSTFLRDYSTSRSAGTAKARPGRA